MSQSSLRVLVIGAGLGGLCLAQGLRKAGVEVAVYERDAGLSVRTQGHRIHIDSRGEQALRECLPSSLYDLFLATRGQPSRGITVFSIVDGQLKEGVTQPFPAGGSDEFITIGSAVDRLTLRQVLLAGLDDITHFSKGEHERLLSDLFGLCGQLPMSAQTYLHCMTPHSANALALPLRQGGHLTSFQNIHVPILGVIGDQDESEYTVIPIKDAVELLKTENSRAEVYQVEKSNHVFSGKEAEVIALIADFMQRNILV